MQLGMIGLGRMGGNIARRLMQHGHEAVVYDRDTKAVAALAHEGAINAAGLDDLVRHLRKPRTVWVMLPAGKITETTISELADRLESGDVVLDCGNTFWKDTSFGKALKNATSIMMSVPAVAWGWTWHCMMIGGEKRSSIASIRSFLRWPGSPRTLGCDGRDPRAERGYIHAGPNGAGHLMVHNGIEYGLMQAFAEGLDILECRQRSAAETNASIWTLPTLPRFGVGERHQFLAARSHRLGAGTGFGALRLFRVRRGFRRRSVDDHGCDRGSCASRCAVRRALYPVPVAPRAHVRGKSSLRHAKGFR